MIISLCAIGKFKKTESEQALTLDYIDRANVTGRGLGLSPVRLLEYDTKINAPHKEKESALILENISQSAFLIVLDENGANLKSREFAKLIEHQKDIGTKEIIFAIGGAEGHGEALKNRANQIISFGKLTWPHKLVRTMAAEQIYRAINIIAGTPYHKD